MGGNEPLDEAAAAIPRATIILRNVAQFSTGPTAGRRGKISRNALLTSASAIAATGK